MESMTFLFLWQNDGAHPFKTGVSPLLPEITALCSEFFFYKKQYTSEA